MPDELISQFIDDELDLEEKVSFVETVHASPAFKTDCLAFLALEQKLRAPSGVPAPRLPLPQPRRRPLLSRLRPLGYPAGLVASALAASLAVFLFLGTPAQAPTSVHYRFVLYRPDVQRAAIAGTFTDWQRTPMRRLGDSGYWELQLDLPRGEHRFAYILENDIRLPDPTLPARERDDFGGENSILRLGA